MADGGWSGKVTIYDGASDDEIKGMTSVSFSAVLNGQDTTDIDSANSTRTRKRIEGLFDCTITLSGFYLIADAGQDTAWTEYLSGTARNVKFLPDGTNGLQVTCLVESIEISNDNSSPAQISITLRSDGTDDPTAV